MRSLIAITLLIAAAHNATADAPTETRNVEARKQAISANIKAAAKTLNKHEHLIAGLQVAPTHRMSAQAFKTFVVPGEGWSAITADGVWSLGERSSLYIKLGDVPRKKLLLQGRYFNGDEATRLFINGQLVSETPLKNHAVRLPADLDTAKPIHIELHHLKPLAPNAVNPDNPDTRPIKFKLQHLRIW